jgi:hypothetical protein
MSDFPEEDHPGIAKIKQMWDRGEFDKLERIMSWWEKFGETNARAMRWFEALENLGKLGGLLQRFVIWSGIIAGGYFAFTGHITEWIRGLK